MKDNKIVLYPCSLLIDLKKYDTSNKNNNHAVLFIRL